jgi:tetratricopeptide (TPR) repeat protein
MNGQNLTLSLLLLVSGSLLTAQEVHDVDRLERQRRARQYFINGTTLQLQGNRHAEAILEFQESLRYDSSAATLTAMSRSYLELGKLDRAEQTSRRALELDNRSRDAWEVLAEVLISSGEYDEGVEAYEHVRELSPTRRQLYTLGRLYEPRNAEKAIQVFEELVRTDPDVGVFRRLASLYRRKRDLEGEIRSLERARDMDVENATITSDLIQVYIHAGQLPEAIDACRHYQVIAGGSASTEHVWASLLQGVFEDSLVANLHVREVQLLLDESMRTYPTSATIHFLVGGVGLRIGDLPRANAAFHHASMITGGNADLVLQIGVLYMREDRVQEAMRFLIDRQPQFPDDPRFLIVIGDAMWSSDRLQDAAVYYRSALELDPLLPDTWAQLGMVYDILEEADSSDSAYERAIALDPMNISANNNYAYSLAVRGQQIDRARQMAWTALQQNPENPAYLDTYAWVLFKSGELEKAEKYIERAVRRGGNATHYEHWGDILEAQGQFDSAVRAWREALDRDPSRTSIRTKIDRYR